MVISLWQSATGFVGRFVIRWYTSGSSERYLVEYLESVPGDAYRCARSGSGVADAAAAAAAAAAGRSDARRPSVAHHPGAQGRSSAGRVLARRHRRPVPRRGDRGSRGRRPAHTRWTERGEEDRRRQVLGGAAVPVLRLLPGRRAREQEDRRIRGAGVVQRLRPLR